jgi:hypothetical protein
MGGGVLMRWGRPSLESGKRRREGLMRKKRRKQTEVGQMREIAGRKTYSCADLYDVAGAFCPVPVMEALSKLLK